MLGASKNLANPSKGCAFVAPEPRYRLFKPALLRDLMERTGTGASISGRSLADAVGVPHGTIDALLRGHTKTQPCGIAHAIADVIGVDLLVLWAPTGRAVSADNTGEIQPRARISA
ncbi:helix-turn-helix transcriptional regulator [Streptomyces spectabilis]|uniref:helix-turn-helix domain-containing protein n=1 Tax=Streptomyces spectabilis TaxID=68270 RepID=UPI0033D1B18E